MIFDFLEQSLTLGENMLNIRTLLIGLILVIPSISFSQEIFSWKCKNNKCDLYAVLNSGKKERISQEWGEDLADKIVFKKYSDTLASLRFGCGNNCNYTKFINLENGDVTEIYYNVLAVNPKNNIVVVLDAEGEDAHTLLVTSIFNRSKLISITRSDMYRTSDVSAKANFMPDGKLQIQYLTSDEGDDKTEIITIDYQKLRENLIDKIYKIINFSEKL